MTGKPRSLPIVGSFAVDRACAVGVIIDRTLSDYPTWSVESSAPASQIRQDPHVDQFSPTAAPDGGRPAVCVAAAVPHDVVSGCTPDIAGITGIDSTMTGPT